MELLLSGVKLEKLRNFKNTFLAVCLSVASSLRCIFEVSIVFLAERKFVKWNISRHATPPHLAKKLD